MNDPKRLKEIDVYISPKKAIQRMLGVIEKYGFDEATRARTFQQTREAWVAAIFLINQTNLTNKLYWLKSNPDPKDVPDVYAVSYRSPRVKSNEIGIVQKVLLIEVSEYHEQAHLSLAENIIRKLKYKKYHKDTVLIYYLDTHKTFTFVINDVVSELNKHNLDIAQIWLMFHPLEQSETVNNLIKVFPNGYSGVQQVNHLFLLKNNSPIEGSAIDYALYNQPDFLKPERGGNSEPIIEHFGDAIIPLPEKI